MPGLTQILIKFGPFISPAIFCLVPVCAVFLGIAYAWSKKILTTMSVKNEMDYKQTSFNWINFFYTVFLAIVSLFPLLGMLGTVLSLLALDISTENTDALKQNFFIALDTTAWGLVFSIIFKAVHSFVQTKIETAITKIDELIRLSYK
ncbi:MAG: MotA/TolQ/ExbB proton channel family protein [Oscillospiraceae bacterium]|nr:MotA/TolQ/ExbB proton channel family protein [Oscillospiraceae bacterium]